MSTVALPIERKMESNLFHPPRATEAHPLMVYNVRNKVVSWNSTWVCRQKICDRWATIGEVRPKYWEDFSPVISGNNLTAVVRSFRSPQGNVGWRRVMFSFGFRVSSLASYSVCSEGNGLCNPHRSIIPYNINVGIEFPCFDPLSICPQSCVLT